MLSVITGKQRAGKTYYCVTLIVSYLQKTTRNIYTNLPLNPDILCNYACKGKLKNPALYEAYLKRLHIFVNFKNKQRKNITPFKKLNPDYFSCHKVNHTQLLSLDKIRTFWKITEPNSIMLLDELYQFFSASDVFDTTTKELRKELLTYSRQHGHFKDDMYLVSHSQHDLDIHIRRGIQRQFVISNSKYTNIFENVSWLRGLKYPNQFFIVKAYEYGETEISDRYIVHPEKIIFKCYNSFSTAETLSKKAVSEDAKNSDSGVDNKENIFNYIKQVAPFFALVLCLASGFSYAGWIFYTKFIGTKTVMTSSKQSYSTKDVQTQKPLSSPSDPLATSDFLKPIFISPDVIIFENKQSIKIGSIISSYVVKKISSDSVMFSNGLSVLISGLLPRSVPLERSPKI